MKTKAITLAVGLLIGFGAFAQSTFKVLSARGENVIQKGADYEPLGPGMQLPSNAKIMIGEAGIVELSNSNNQTLTLNTPGIYTMNDISGDFKADNSNLAQRYLEFVFNEMSAKSESRTSNLAITGSVERSLDDATINVYSPESTYIMSKETNFLWTSEEPAESYKVVVRNLFDEEVISLVVENSSANIDLSQIEFEEDAIYKFSVEDPANPSKKSDEVILRIPTKSETELITKDLSEIEKDGDANSPIYHMLMAKYYRLNGLYVDAVHEYEQALALAPEAESIQMEYNSFLKEAGVKE